MASEQEVIVLVKLAGQREYAVNTAKVVASNEELALSTKMAGAEMEATSKRSWLLSQSLFTLRRFAYMGTLALTGFGVAALKLGFDYNAAMQTARVALTPFFHDTVALNDALNELWQIAKYSPFTIQTMTTAFRQLYPAFQQLGISPTDTIAALKSLIDGLAVSGKVTGPALNRVTVALQHMAFQGRITGQNVLQLARDGIPIFPILEKELGLTADQLEHIGKAGIPAQVAMQAIIQYMRDTPGYADAAKRQAQQTLTGLFAQFKDDISQMMGTLEQGAFGGVQRRLVSLDTWFTNFQNRFKGQTLSIRQVIEYAFGRGAARIWDQFASALHQTWVFFSQIVKIIVSNKEIWIALLAALFALAQILRPINWLLKNFGDLLYVLLPLYVTWRVYIMALVTWEKLQFFWTAANTKAMKDQTFAMFLLNGALRGYRAILASVTIAQGIWTVLMGGTVRNANGTFRAMTFLERVARSLRYAFILLFTQMRILATFLYESLVPAFIRTAIAAAATWVAALGPIAWIIAGVIALIAILTVLYFKWKWFHDLVNRTVRFLWEHPFVAWFIPVIGPLLVIVRLITFIFNHLGAIARFFGKAWHFAGHVLGAVGLQSGGTMRQPGFALVGERGPELLLLPGGSTVLPLPATTVNKHLGGGAHETAAPLKKDFKAGYSGSQDWGPEKPLVIQLLLDKKVLEEVVVRRQSNRMSRR